MHPIILLPTLLAGFVLGRVVHPRDRDSPLAGVPLLKWEQFVAVMCLAPKSHVSDRGRLGTFQMDARRLRDVGLMSDAVKGQRGSMTGVWVGRWKTPLTEAKFLGSMPLQYAAFVRSMVAAAPKVTEHVGKVVDGKPCSLSGLLGVSHAAGEGGVGSWVDGGKRFPRTTEMFERTNQIF